MSDDRKVMKPLLFGKAPKTDAEKHHDTEASHKASLTEPPEGGWDSAYVEGFSDQRHMNEKLKAKGQKPIDLPANLAWVPKEYKGFMPWQKLGYRVITDAQPDRTSNLLNQHGWGFPPAGHVAADGTIAKDDMLLAYIPADLYAKVQRDEADKRKFMETGVGAGSIDMETEESRKIDLSSEEEGFYQ
jgi:hypothetical protein